MGLANPRPAIRSREDRIIRARLKRHHELMTELMAKGKPKDEASKLAFEQVKKEHFS